MADGTLIFDTKLDLSEYQKALKTLQGSAKSGATDIEIDVTVDDSKAKKAAKQVQSTLENTDAEIKVGAEADSADARQAAQQVEREAEKADPKVKVKTDVDTADVKGDVDDLADEVKDGLRRAGDPFNSSGDIEIDARVNTSGVSDEMRSTARRASGVGDIIKGAIGANIIQEAGEKLIDFAKDAVMAASDLEEVQNVVDVTFGSAADEINKFATDGAKAFGLTELQTKKYAGTLGSLFKSMGLGQDEVTDMSIAMSGLVGDMASFYNLDYETAFEKLRSGISGETEPLKQLGVNMSVANLEAFSLSQGIQKTYEEMTEAEKATLRYNYIMQATADAQGDFARTSDGFANQVRMFQNNMDSLKAKVGEALLPALNSALNLVNGIFDGSAGIGGKTQLQQEIDAAAESLSGVETNITNLKNQYANTVLKIGIEYESSQALLDDYEKLSSLEALSDEDLEQMKTIVERLVEIYPQLEQYVGKDGLFSKEAGEVRALTAEYKALAEQKAYTQMVEGIYGEYLKANFEYATLGEKSNQANAEVASLEDQYNKLISLSQQLEQLGGFDPLSMKDPAKVQQTADALQAYIDAFGPLDEGLLNRLSEAGIDIGTFMSSLGDTSQLDPEGIQSLFATVSEIYNSTDLRDSIATTQEQLTAAQEASTTAAQALSDGLGVLQTAQSELDTALATYSQMTGDSASEIVSSVQSQLESGGATIATSAGEINAKMAKGIGNTEAIGSATQTALGIVGDIVGGYTPPTIKIPVVADLSNFSLPSGNVPVGPVARDGSHATGLNYVPYDNYVANLHRGESVLRADDAAAWRAAKKSGGSSGSMDAVADALSDLAAQPVNVYIDSEKVGEAVRGTVSRGQNSMSRSRATGVVK